MAGQRAVARVVREVRREAAPFGNLDRDERVVLRARRVTDVKLLRRCGGGRHREHEQHRQRGDGSEELAHPVIPFLVGSGPPIPTMSARSVTEQISAEYMCDYQYLGTSQTTYGGAVG